MPRKRLPALPGINKLSHEYKQFTAYLEADDSEQYDIVRDRWAKINWHLLDKCEQAVDALQKGESPAKISPLIISAGIGFDKLYSKRTEQSKPLSFPTPLLEMVRKGLKLPSREPVSMHSTQAAVQAIPDSSGELRTKHVNALKEQDSQVDIIDLTGRCETSGALSAQSDACVTKQTISGVDEPRADDGQVETTGGVAWSDPQADGRGHGATLSRLDQSVPNISETVKSLSTQAQDVQRSTRDPVQAAKALRHERKAARVAMMQAQRKSIREGVPYQRPPDVGGVV